MLWWNGASGKHIMSIQGIDEHWRLCKKKLFCYYVWFPFCTVLVYIYIHCLLVFTAFRYSSVNTESKRLASCICILSLLTFCWLGPGQRGQSNLGSQRYGTSQALWSLYLSLIQFIWSVDTLQYKKSEITPSRKIHDRLTNVDSDNAFP